MAKMNRQIEDEGRDEVIPEGAAECDFEFEGTEGSTNLWRCRVCRKFIRVLGDFCPPKKLCDRNPSSRPLSAHEVARDTLQMLLREHKDAYGVEFWVSRKLLATWSKSGLEMQEGAAKLLDELQKHIATTPSGQRAYKIPYRVWVGEKLIQGEHSRVIEKDIHPTGE
jgi:hypothetical protein